MGSALTAGRIGYRTASVDLNHLIPVDLAKSTYLEVPVPLIPFNGVMPKVHDSVFIAEGAQVIGDVTIGEGSSIWFNVVVRGDVNAVIIGRNTNIQDNSTIHSDPRSSTVIGDEVSVGHNAVVHGCTVGNKALIAIHATVLTGAVIGEGSIVGAGAVVGEDKEIPPGRIALGAPARVIREVSTGLYQRSIRRAQIYVDLSRQYLSAADRKQGE